MHTQFRARVQKLTKTKIDFFRPLEKVSQFNYVVISSFTCSGSCTDNLRCKIVPSPFEIHANSAINPQKPGILDSLVALLMRSNTLHNKNLKNHEGAKFIKWKKNDLSAQMFRCSNESVLHWLEIVLHWLEIVLHWLEMERIENWQESNPAGHLGPQRACLVQLNHPTARIHNSRSVTENQYQG